MKEIWKPVVGYEDLYEVSNLGNVRSLNYLGHEVVKNLAVATHYSGYRQVVLQRNYKRKNATVHILVAKAFLPNRDGKPCVNHIDGNKANNNVENLEWVTYRENTRHAINSGLRPDCMTRGKLGRDNKLSKPVAQIDSAGNVVKVWPGISEAARHLGCAPCTIINCCKGRIKSCKGYRWKLISDFTA